MAKNSSNPIVNVIACILSLVISFVAGFFGTLVLTRVNNDQSNIVVSSFEIHFMTLGNENAGDCIYIKAGNNDILVDGGSDTDSINSIRNYVDQFVTDGKFEYLIVTHADKDHIACFGGTSADNTSLFDYYKFGTIIDFARTNKDTQIYNRYVQKRDREVSQDGAVHYTALECVKNQNGAKKEYDLGNNIKLEILEHEFYSKNSSDENNYSVCFMLKHSNRNFLFTGDLEKEGEESLVEMNSLPQVEFFKAGHHGSKTSSNTALLEQIKPNICVVPCVAGSVEYTQDLDNTFPTKAFLNRISEYTDKVYVPAYATIEFNNSTSKWENKSFADLNGNIVIKSKSAGVVVECSNHNKILKETDWYKNYPERSKVTNWL